MSPDEDLLAAVAAGDTDRVARSLSLGASANATRNYTTSIDREVVEGSESALMTAALASRTDLARLLLNAGADANFRDPLSGRTPLIEAAAKGNAELVDALLVAGAAADLEDGRSRENAVAAAIAGGHASVTRQLLTASAPITPKSLEHACRLGRPDLAQLSLDAGLTPVEARVLSSTAISGHVVMIHWLIAHGADLASEGPAALCEAANAGRTAVVSTLIEQGVPIESRSSYGWTPLHFAAYNADPATVEVLLRAGADPHADDGTGKTPLDWAQEAGKSASVALIAAAQEKTGTSR